MTAGPTAHDRAVTQPAHEYVLNAQSHAIMARVIETAIELRMFDLLDKRGPFAADDLIDELGLDPKLAPDFLGALHAVGLLVCAGGTVANSEMASHLMVRHRDGYLGGALERWHRDDRWKWSRLKDLLLSGSGGGRPSAMDKDYYRLAYERTDPESFLSTMDEIVGVVVPQLDRFDWSRVRTFVDVGGGRGVLATSLVSRHPWLTGTVFELPALASYVEAHLAGAAAVDAVRLVTGNFFTDPVPPAEVFVLGHVLANLRPAAAAELVARLADSLPGGGRLLIYDPMLGEVPGTVAVGGGLPVVAAAHVASLSAALNRSEGGHHAVGDYRDWCARANLGIDSESRLATPVHDVLIVASKRGSVRR